MWYEFIFKGVVYVYVLCRCIVDFKWKRGSINKNKLVFCLWLFNWDIVVYSWENNFIVYRIVNRFSKSIGKNVGNRRGNW